MIIVLLGVTFFTGIQSTLGDKLFAFSNSFYKNIFKSWSWFIDILNCFVFCRTTVGKALAEMVTF